MKGHFVAYVARFSNGAILEGAHLPSFGTPTEQLRLETLALPPANPLQMRVAMTVAPVNPSDLIPITGAYSHRIQLPAVAGYEGVGRVIHAPETHAELIGRRVLPLRGTGTWQSYVDCDPDLAVPAPDTIGDLVAARAYINPLAALTMLDTFPVAGKRVLLSGAGSACAELLGRWAQEQGAAKIQGIYRSDSRVKRLIACGIEPISMNDIQAVTAAAREADLAFDALGGPVGSIVIDAMLDGTVFIAYGLLSGQSIRPSGTPRASYRRFHLRDYLATMPPGTWQRQFLRLWQALLHADPPPVQAFAVENWKSAVEQALRPGAAKPMLCFGCAG
ncbi:zinc-dependent alcohol dehydrogenase family protein [Paraburkholderia sp. HD33-4]|uniref:zinc-dependent alcohol dehydrogenase family protein n=1 Tax=Paraburkholderia sp. HD33-4 TaxID=2883242 RepID=UPI001F39F492|nr:zinc-dependent alcohol dehydrogenase family protein [Paraburkholderia sp. HD33-4]